MCRSACVLPSASPLRSKRYRNRRTQCGCADFSKTPAVGVRTGAAGAFLRVCPIEEGHDLPPGTGPARRKVCGAGACGNALFRGPCNGICGITGASDIRKRCRSGGGGTSRSPPQKGCYLRPGAGAIRAKAGAAEAVGNALLQGPEYGGIVVFAAVQIRKVCGGAGGAGRSGCPPEKGDDLPPSTGMIRTKAIRSQPGRNFLIQRPKYRVIIVAVL